MPSLDGVYYLRSVGDSLRLRSTPSGVRRRVAVIGAGWIGSEVAASARQMGADVVLIDPAPTPLHGVLGDEIGGVFAKLHADHGVELRLGTKLRELRGTSRSTRSCSTTTRWSERTSSSSASAWCHAPSSPAPPG